MRSAATETDSWSLETDGWSFDIEKRTDKKMKRVWQMTIGLATLGAVVLASGYFVDHHRCKQINYERAGYELPARFLISAKHCLAAANAVRLRSFARDV